MNATRGQTTVDEVLDAMERTGELHAVQRNVVVLYALLGGLHQVIDEPAYKLAERLSMTPAGFSRVRRELVEAGWLELVHKVSNIPFYRLADRATGRQTVVQLRA